MPAGEQASRPSIYSRIWRCLVKGTVLGGNGMKRKAWVIPERLGRILHDKDQFPWSQNRTMVRKCGDTFQEGFLDLASLNYVTLS